MNQKGRRGNNQNQGMDEAVISVDRISRMTAGGRRMRFRATMAVGDREGQFGIGCAKANDVSDAINKAKKRAKKSLIDVPVVNDTIPHKLQIQYKGSEILFKPAAPGTGIIAGGVVRKSLELAGVKNILTKVLGSQNKINNLKATYNALEKLQGAKHKEDLMKAGKDEKKAGKKDKAKKVNKKKATSK